MQRRSNATGLLLHYTSYFATALPALRTHTPPSKRLRPFLHGTPEVASAVLGHPPSLSP